MLNIISLGVGVQSTALYLQSSLGFFPRADYAIFSDTGKEKKQTLVLLSELIQWSKKNNGIKIIHATERNLFYDLLKNKIAHGSSFQTIPSFTKNNDGSVGMLKRQCTLHYKIRPVDSVIRSIHGLKPYARMPFTRVWKGISLDEMSRMSIPQEAWKISAFPFVGYEIPYNSNPQNLVWAKKMSRTDLLKWYSENGFDVPVKSSCVFCPYQSNKSWRDLKQNFPSDFADAVLVDEAIRNSTAKGISNPTFLHKSLTPLSEIDFLTSQIDMFEDECLDGCHT